MWETISLCTLSKVQAGTKNWVSLLRKISYTDQPQWNISCSHDDFLKRFSLLKKKNHRQSVTITGKNKQTCCCNESTCISNVNWKGGGEISCKVADLFQNLNLQALFLQGYKFTVFLSDGSLGTEFCSLFNCCFFAGWCPSSEEGVLLRRHSFVLGRLSGCVTIGLLLWLGKWTETLGKC